MAAPTMPLTGRIAPCLWFDGTAEEAANLYVSIFPNSRITGVTRYSEAGRETHGQVPGSVMTIQFELDGQPFTGLNGGPQFRFSESISFQVGCSTQEEIDWFWERLGEGGDPDAQVCGWLKDRFGVSWQVVPSIIAEVLTSDDPEASARVTAAFMAMKKLDVAALERAKAG